MYIKLECYDRIVMHNILKIAPCNSQLGDSGLNKCTLRDLYAETVVSHNKMVIADRYSDSGFDLFSPASQGYSVPASAISHKLPMGVKCSMETSDGEPLPFYVYPRSSTGSKTPLRLCNSVGIIDSGYRGEIMAVFDNISNDSFPLEHKQRLVQICSPDLSPFIVQMVGSEDDLTNTRRGTGGLGSTGK